MPIYLPSVNYKTVFKILTFGNFLSNSFIFSLNESKFQHLCPFRRKNKFCSISISISGLIQNSHQSALIFYSTFPDSLTVIAVNLVPFLLFIHWSVVFMDKVASESILTTLFVQKWITVLCLVRNVKLCVTP